jgi:hypothetical protein
VVTLDLIGRGKILRTVRRHLMRGLGCGVRTHGTASPLSGRPWAAQIATVARLATSWIVAFALLLQIAATAVSPATGTGPLDLLTAAEICHTVDPSAPADSSDRVVVRFKCIACVVACSLPPPALLAVSIPTLSWTWRSPTWPPSVAASRSAPAASHSARGPPVLA